MVLLPKLACQEAPTLGVGQVAAMTHVLRHSQQLRGGRRGLLAGKGLQDLWAGSVLLRLLHLAMAITLRGERSAVASIGQAGRARSSHLTRAGSGAERPGAPHGPCGARDSGYKCLSEKRVNDENLMSWVVPAWSDQPHAPNFTPCINFLAVALGTHFNQPSLTVASSTAITNQWPRHSIQQEVSRAKPLICHPPCSGSLC